MCVSVVVLVLEVIVVFILLFGGRENKTEMQRKSKVPIYPFGSGPSGLFLLGEQSNQQVANRQYHWWFPAAPWDSLVARFWKCQCLLSFLITMSVVILLTNTERLLHPAHVSGFQLSTFSARHRHFSIWYNLISDVSKVNLSKKSCMVY